LLPTRYIEYAAVQKSAAAAVGSTEAIRGAHEAHVHLLWSRNYTFGRPLAAAAAGGHFNLVLSIVKYFESIYR
jgi:hypothetical protein